MYWSFCNKGNIIKWYKYFIKFYMIILYFWVMFVWRWNCYLFRNCCWCYLIICYSINFVVNKYSCKVFILGCCMYNFRCFNCCNIIVILIWKYKSIWNIFFYICCSGCGFFMSCCYKVKIKIIIYKNCIVNRCNVYYFIFFVIFVNNFSN